MAILSVVLAVLWACLHTQSKLQVLYNRGVFVLVIVGFVVTFLGFTIALSIQFEVHRRFVEALVQFGYSVLATTEVSYSSTFFPIRQCANRLFQPVYAFALVFPIEFGTAFIPTCILWAAALICAALLSFIPVSLSTKVQGAVFTCRVAVLGIAILEHAVISIFIGRKISKFQSSVHARLTRRSRGVFVAASVTHLLCGISAVAYTATNGEADLNSLLVSNLMCRASFG